MPAEGGVMMVRAKDDIYRMAEFKRQKDRHFQEYEPDQERLVAHSGAPGDRADASDERHDHERY